MHFTQEDYKKIENWLLMNSVKDSEFQEALPLEGDETIVIIQGGHNRIITIEELSKIIARFGMSDFINVSNNYNAYKITLQEAVSLIPPYLRKRGMVITFYNTDDNWEVRQFKGVENQWNNVTLWEIV